MTNLQRNTLQIALAASLAFCTGCGSEAAAPKAEARTIANPLEIAPDEDLQKRIKVGKPQWQSVSGMLRVAGRVEADGTRMARVSAPVTGRIIEMTVMEGEQVKRGQTLATIYSTELSTAQSAYLKAESQLHVGERAVERARQLLDAGVIGSAELQRREADLQESSADVAAAREQLRVLGLTEETIRNLKTTRGVNSTTHIVSSIDGIVLERKATVGQVVQAVEPVFVIADLANVWLVADVPEQSAGAIRVGKKVEAEIPALPNRKIVGTLSFVSATVDPETRTVQTRMNLANPERVYKPAMLATLSLVDGAERRLVLPAAAVVREGDADYAFVQTSPGVFLLRRIGVSADLGDKRVIGEGLLENDQVVVEGAFHLNNERKRRALGDEEG